MRGLLLFLAVLLSCTFTVLGKDTGQAQWDNGLGVIGDLLQHDHKVADRDNPVGMGADVTVFKTNGVLEEVNIEVRGDFVNEEVSVYAVAKIDLWGFLFENKKEVQE